MKKLKFAILFFCVTSGYALAQDSSPADNSPPPITASPAPTSTATPSPSPTAPTRTIHLNFVPPPMEGTISLGIFDGNKKLVRVLHRETKVDGFVVGENSLGTTWDGKNDAGEDVAAGKYHARGYMVDRQLSATDMGPSNEPASNNGSDHLPVKLEINPLVGDTRSVVELAVGFDNHGTFLKTMDGLPLRTISQSAQLTRVSTTKRSETMLDVWQDDGQTVERFEVANVQAMMAFDCGDFTLK